MANDISFTGERFVPGIPGEIEFEHVHRYVFARRFLGGKRVLDVACGEGYGTALLAGTAAHVTGVDIDEATIAHAAHAYKARANVAFRCASAAALPFDAASFDAIVSFETIEHLPAELQPAMLAEFARVLVSDGLLVLSAPNRVEYSDKRGYANPFHAHEHDRAELVALIGAHFPAQRFHHQQVWLGSTLWSETGTPGYAAFSGDAQNVEPATLPPAMYYVVLAARAAGTLPPDDAGVTLFSQPDMAELHRLQGQGAEILRLDALLGERTASLDERSAHVHHLENLVTLRDALIEERDTAIGRLTLVESRAASLAHQLEHEQAHAAMQDALLAQRASQIAQQADELAQQAAELAQRDSALAHHAAENARLEAELAAQERIIAYRQSARWWLRLPLVRLRGLWLQWFR